MEVFFEKQYLFFTFLEQIFVVFMDLAIFAGFFLPGYTNYFEHIIIELAR